MIVTVFRSRVKPEMQQEYMPWVARMKALATGMPGFISHKAFTAEDGERVELARILFELIEGLHRLLCGPDRLPFGVQEIGTLEVPPRACEELDNGVCQLRVEHLEIPFRHLCICGIGRLKSRQHGCAYP